MAVLSPGVVIGRIAGERVRVEGAGKANMNDAHGLVNSWLACIAQSGADGIRFLQAG